MLKSNYKWQENYNKITAVCNKERRKNKTPNGIGLWKENASHGKLYFFLIPPPSTINFNSQNYICKSLRMLKITFMS